MLCSELEGQAIGGQEPASQQPLEMSQLGAANVEKTHCLMHRCEDVGEAVGGGPSEPALPEAR